MITELGEGKSPLKSHKILDLMSRFRYEDPSKREVPFIGLGEPLAMPVFHAPVVDEDPIENDEIIRSEPEHQDSPINTQ